MKFFLQTQIGIESITEIELERKFKGKYSLDYSGYIPHKNGMVQIDWRSVEGEILPWEELGTIEDAYFVLDYIPNVNEVLDLKGVYKLLDMTKIKKNLDFFFDSVNPFDKSPDFRIITRKKAAHDFRRIDLQSSVADFFKKNIKRAHITDIEGVKEIWVTLVKNRLIVAVRLTTKTKRHSYYKTKFVDASLRPTVAFAMDYIAEVQSKDIVWDPFCGAGTIGCEIVDNFKFKKLIVSDISPDAIAAAKENFANLNSYKTHKGKVSFRNEDFFESKNYATIAVSNLPFGNKYETDTDFVAKFFDKVSDIKELKRLVLLYPHMIEHPDWQLERKFPVEVLGYHGFILRYRRR